MMKTIEQMQHEMFRRFFAHNGLCDCEANEQFLRKFLKEEGLDVTYENAEVAAQAVGAQLANPKDRE
jgi:hypothetical protein